MQIAEKIDKQLAEQLEQADKSQDSVQAWFRLKSENPTEPAPSPDKTESLAHNIVARVRKRLGENIQSINIQRSLGTFMIEAKSSFLREILHEPEIVFAGATYVPGFELIKPVKRQVIVPSGRKQGTRTKRSGR